MKIHCRLWLFCKSFEVEARLSNIVTCFKFPKWCLIGASNDLKIERWQLVTTAGSTHAFKQSVSWFDIMIALHFKSWLCPQLSMHSMASRNPSPIPLAQNILKDKNNLLTAGQNIYSWNVSSVCCFLVLWFTLSLVCEECMLGTGVVTW